MKLSAAVLMCLLCYEAKAQIDSLRNALESAQRQKGPAKLVATLQGQMGWTFLRDRRYDSAVIYLHQSLRTTKIDTALVASNYNSLGIVYSNLGLPDSAVEYYKKALVLFEAKNDTLNRLAIGINLAIIYKNEGLYEKALETVFSVIGKLEHMPPDRAMASSYNTIAGVYAQMGDLPNALNYYQRALAIRKAINYDRGIGQSYNNIGETFIGMAMYDSALPNLLRALDIKRRMKDANATGTTLNLIGLAHLRQGQYREAEPALVEALSIKRAAGEQLEEGMALNNLATLKIATHNLEEAEKYLDKAIKLFRVSHALAHLRDGLELRVRLYKELGNASMALKASEDLLVIKDSLLNKDKVESLLAMQVKYETEKKEQQIRLLEQDRIIQNARLGEHRYWILGLASVIALLGSLIVFVYVTFRITRRNKRRVETLLKELHHRVKNNLQLLSSIFSLQVKSLTDERAIQAVRTSEARVNAMALIHRKLYNADHNRTLNIADYIKELVEYLIHAYGYQESSIKIVTNINEAQVDVDKAIPLGLILNELISNAFKYAYSEQPNPELFISLQFNNDQMEIGVSDNGIGLPDTYNSQSDSFGLRMVHMFVNQLDGSIETNVSEGTQYVLKIPTE